MTTSEAEQWADIAEANSKLLTEVITKLTSAERDRDGWELIAADQAAVVKQVLADLMTACDDLDAAERRAAAAERERDQQASRYAELLDQTDTIRQELVRVMGERDEALADRAALAASDSADLALVSSALITALAALSAATARERAAREILLDYSHDVVYDRGLCVHCGESDQAFHTDDCLVQRTESYLAATPEED